MERYAYCSPTRKAVQATIQTQVDIDAPLSEHNKAANELVESSMRQHEKAGTKRENVLHRLLSITTKKDGVVTYTYGIEHKRYKT